jgi:hypothetical protein
MIRKAFSSISGCFNYKHCQRSKSESEPKIANQSPKALWFGNVPSRRGDILAAEPRGTLRGKLLPIRQSGDHSPSPVDCFRQAKQSQS